MITGRPEPPGGQREETSMTEPARAGIAIRSHPIGPLIVDVTGYDAAGQVQQVQVYLTDLDACALAGMLGMRAASRDQPYPGLSTAIDLEH
jgi:hypothetical protein